MADTVTANYNWVKPEVGASTNTWGTKINTDLDQIDAKIKTIDVPTAATKATLVDADIFGVFDSAASNVAKKHTWANLKAALLTYMNTNVQVNNANWNGTDLSIANGGTSASDAPSARFNLAVGGLADNNVWTGANRFNQGIQWANDDYTTYDDTINTWDFVADSSTTPSGTVRTYRLRLLATTDVDPGSAGAPLQIGADDSANLAMDTNEIMARNGAGALANLIINENLAVGSVSGSATLGGNTVWHAGNDGAGSGLDSDLLDGQHGTYYRDLANSTGTLPNARISGAYDGITNLSMTGTLLVQNSAPEVKLLDTTSGSYSARLRVNSNNVYFDSSTDDVTFGEVFRFELDTKRGYVNASRIWTDEYANAAKLNAVYGYTPLDAATFNARTLTAGNGLSGGGALSANRTFTLGTPSDITNATTNSVTTTSHTHALGFLAAEVYTGSSASYASFPVGTILQVHRGGDLPDRNGTLTPAIRTDNTYGYISSTHALAGTSMSGTWRSRGFVAGDILIMQRTA